MLYPIDYLKQNASTIEQQILFHILEEIKILRQDLNVLKKSEAPNEEDLAKSEKESDNICKYCGGVHTKPVEYAHCARRHKKEGK